MQAPKRPEWEPCGICGAAPQYDVYSADRVGTLPTIETKVRCSGRILCAAFGLVLVQAPNAKLSLDLARRAWNAMQRDGVSDLRTADREFADRLELMRDERRTA